MQTLVFTSPFWSNAAEETVAKEKGWDRKDAKPAQSLEHGQLGPVAVVQAKDSWNTHT